MNNRPLMTLDENKAFDRSCAILDARDNEVEEGKSERIPSFWRLDNFFGFGKPKRLIHNGLQSGQSQSKRVKVIVARVWL
jgi:hypothetical protein